MSENFWKNIAFKCLDCEYFDGYDLCLHSKQPHPTIYEESLIKCPLNIYKEIKPKENRKYFLRFGDLPENGKSSIYRGETKVGEEQGISVFDCTQDTFQLILPQELTRSLMCDIQGFFNYSDRPLYLVSGIQVGLGHDNEPIIIDAKIEKEILYNKQNKK